MDGANHLAEDDDNQKDDDVTVSFGEEETTKTLLFGHQTQDQQYTDLSAMVISCAYLTPRIKQRAMLCRCSLLRLKLTLITSLCNSYFSQFKYPGMNSFDRSFAISNKSTKNY